MLFAHSWRGLTLGPWQILSYLRSPSMSSPEPTLPRSPDSGPRGASPSAATAPHGLEAIELLGMQLASCSEAQLLDALFDALARQRGGWLITANLDFLRR